MKYIIAIISIWFCALFAFAEVIQQGNVLKSSVSSTVTEQPTLYFYEIEGVQYPVYKSPNNSFYIKRISKKTGKEYKYYLPKEVQEKLKFLCSIK